MTMKGKGKQVVGKVAASAAPSSSVKRKTAASENPGGCRNRRRRPGVLQFFDDAAVDADSDCDNKEESEVDEKIGDLVDFADDGKYENKNITGDGQSHHLPFFVKEELSGDELEELINDRYARGSEHVTYNDDSAECDVKVSEADGMKDVIIWRVKCMVGRERHMTFCFMQKYVEMENLGTKLQISSVFALDHVKGYVFVEADKLYDVIEACKGFCSIYSSRINIVPRSEVPHLLAIQNKLPEVCTGKWVRLKSGKYKGDLAQVVAVDDGQKQLTIKLVPRIDLQAIAKKFGGGISLKLATVPAPRLISSHELESFRPHIEVKRDRLTGELFEVLDGMMLKDGYLFKKVSTGSVIFSGVQPSSSELLMFSDVTNNMVEDLNWVSSIYNARKKKPVAETLDDEVSVVTKNDYSLHDLVLFGQKHCGVIIAVEKDYFKILKGDIEGANVVTVKIQDIKNSCVDKMFTALDWKKTTIFINDIVKILAGPLQGREGVVKHMYKGTLFIHDEYETKNSGFFCVKSMSCEKVKESKNSYGVKAGKGKEANASFSQSPIRIFDRENNARGSTRRGQSDNGQMFSIGQTLRIREGPLKGYLCRVVGIYRSDVTVKLDSLVKLITVKDKSLAVPKIKGDNATGSSDQATISSDHFGLSTACPSFGESSTPAEKSSWDSVMPSFGRDSWQPFSSSNLSVACNNENQTEGCKDDPWGNKLVSVSSTDTGDYDKTMDDWGKKSGSCTDHGHEADPWSNMVTATGKQTSGGSNEITDSWGQELGADPWNSKVMYANRTDAPTSDGAIDGWGNSSNSGLLQKASSGAGDQAGSSEIKSYDWSNKAAVVLRNTDVDGWEKSKTSIGDAGGIWDNENDKKCNACSWDSEGIGKMSKKEDALDKTAKSQEKSNDNWDVAAIGQTQSNNKTCSWDNKEGKISTEDDAWQKAAQLQDQNKNSCDAAAIGGSICYSIQNHGCEVGDWDNAKSPSGSLSGYCVKEKENDKAVIGRSSKAGVSGQSQNCIGDSRMSPKGNYDFSWNKGKDCEGADANTRMNSEKPRELQGVGGLGANDNDRSQDSWSKNHNWGQTSSWEREREQDNGHRNHDNNWSRQKEFNGVRGSSWERGRGFHGASGCMRHDAGDQDWSSGRGGVRDEGRGKARGHSGEAGGKRDGLSDTRSVGQVCNWDKGHGTIETSDWKNQQNSEDSLSNWANDKNADWDKLRNCNQNESSGKTGQMHAWSKNKSLAGHSLSGWSSFSQDADAKKDAIGVDDASSWEKGASLPEGSSNWEKSHTGEQFELSNDDTNKWSTTTTSGWEGGSLKNVPAAPENLHISSCRRFIGDNQDIPIVSDGNKPAWDKLLSSDEGKAAGGYEWDSVKASGAKRVSGWSGWTDHALEVRAYEKPVRGAWDGPRADESCKNSTTSAGINSWEVAVRSDEKAKGVILGKSSDWTHSEVSSGKVDAWDNEGKKRTADGNWDTTTNSQRKKTDEDNNWGDNSKESKEDFTVQGGYQTDSRNAAVLCSTQPGTEQISSWKRTTNSWSGQWKDRQSNDSEDWKQGGSKQSENYTWYGRKLSGEEFGKGDQVDRWSKPREGGHGFRRGKGGGRNSWDSGSWNKQMDHVGNQRSGWGRGRGGNNVADGEKQCKWNKQRDFSEDRGSSWVRGRGRFGTTDKSQGDNSDGPPNQQGRWSGRGRGWGHNSGYNFEGRRHFSHGGGRGSGHSSFFSSDMQDDGENCGDGLLPRNSVLSWGSNENTGWEKSKDHANSEYGGKTNQQHDRSKGKSHDGDSSGCGKRSSNWSKDEADVGEDNNWARTKEFGVVQSSSWNKWSTNTEDIGEASGTCSNFKDAQAAGDQGCSWDKAAGSWDKSTNNEGSGSKGGW
ncbi:unnamed protein product [Musa textilis]